MSEELKPCPACGSCVLKVNHYTCIVECQSCGLRGPFDRESPEKAWNALPRRLRWTKEKPTEPGWYLYRSKESRSICEIHTTYGIPGLFCSILFGEEAIPLSKVDGEWAGPIPEPEE